MEVNKKSAPQRGVTEIIRTGEWGSVIYLHKLDCGHIEERKRPSKTDKIACASCVLADTFIKKQSEFVRTATDYDDLNQIELLPNEYEIAISTTEQEIARIKSSVANYLQIEPDDVIVNIEESEEGSQISGGFVYLTLENLDRLVRLGAAAFSSTKHFGGEVDTTVNEGQ